LSRVGQLFLFIFYIFFDFRVIGGGGGWAEKEILGLEVEKE